MQPSPELRRKVLSLSHLSTARFLWATALDWGIICGSIALSLAHPNNWIIYGLAVFMIATRQHAFLILAHEGAHFRVHRQSFLNDLISDILCAYPILFDTKIYRHTHLQHHDHLNTEQDPDWVRKYQLKEWIFPQSLKQIALFMLTYVPLKGALEWVVAAFHFSGLKKITGYERSAFQVVSKLVFWSIVAGALAWTNQWTLFFWYWTVPFFTVFPGLQRLRSIAEHFGLSYSDDLTSTRDIRPSWLEGFLMAPHNVHFHLCHHLYPSVPFYNLAKLHSALMADAEFARKSHQNDSYILPTTKSLVRDLISTAKKPGSPEQNPQQSSRSAA